MECSAKQDALVDAGGEELVLGEVFVEPGAGEHDGEAREVAGPEPAQLPQCCVGEVLGFVDE